MREKIIAYKWKILFAAILILMAVWSLIRMLLPENCWAFGAEQLEMAGGVYFEDNVINGNEAGWYVDNSMEYGETFAQTPRVNLPVGSYDVTIRYQTEGDGAQYSFTSDISTYRVMLGRTNEKLEAGRVKKTLSTNYTRRVQGFQVSVRYGGDGYLIVSGVDIQQTRALERMVLFAVIFAGACWLIVVRCVRTRNTKMLWACGIVTAAIATVPVLMPYLGDVVDMPFHLLRIEGIAEGLKDGQFPVRMQPQWMNGYGYPVSVFYGEGVLWIAGVLRWIGFPLQLSYKLYIFVINLLAFSIAWYSFQRVTRSGRIAAAGAVIYVLAPYRLLNIYGRAAVGEYTAITFLPLIFVGCYEILMADKKERSNSWIVLMLGMTGIIQSHILTCEIVVLVMGFSCLFFWKRTFEKARLWEFVKAVLGTILINMEFLVPFLDYMREDLYVNSKGYGGYIQTSGAFFNQLLEIFPHGYGTEVSITEGLAESPEKTFAIGIVFVAAIILFGAEYDKNNASKLKKLGLYCSFTGSILVVMSTVWFPWDDLYDLNQIFAVLISRLQFPWRVLGAASLMLTVVVCVVLCDWKERRKQAYLGLSAIMLGAAIVTAGYYISSLVATNEVTYIADVESIGTFDVGFGEYIPSGVNWSRENMPEGKLWHSDQLAVASQSKQGTNFELTCENLSDEIQAVDLPMTYYRGYVARSLENGTDIAMASGENGRIRLFVPERYQGTVLVRFEEPVLWRISEAITLLSVIGLIVYIQRKRLFKLHIGEEI